MSDPFLDVEAAGAAFLEVFVRQLELRAAEPVMARIAAGYLDDLDWPAGALSIDVGCGTGAIARRMAARAEAGRVLGCEPSPSLVHEARELARGIDNLSFAVADGASLPEDDGAAVNVVLHTVLSHVEAPGELVAEAARVLAPGGRLAICDGDFSKASLACCASDPLQIAAEGFVRTHVHDPDICAKLPRLARSAGLVVERERTEIREVRDHDGMRVWVALTVDRLLKDGDIGEPLRDALLSEYDRRRDAGTLRGHQPFGILVARKPR